MVELSVIFIFLHVIFYIFFVLFLKSLPVYNEENKYYLQNKIYILYLFILLLDKIASHRIILNMIQ